MPQPRRRLRTVFEHHIDHAGDGVGTVLRARAVAQHFNPLDRVAGDGVEVDRRGAGGIIAFVQQHRRLVAPLPVDQHQHLVRVQTTHPRRADVVR
jgi:hypothetical protein